MSKKLPVEIVISAVDEVTYKVMAINDKLKKFSEPVDKLNTAFSNLARESGLGAFGEKLGNVKDAFGNFVGSTLKSTAVVGALGYGLFEAAKHSAEFASAIGDTASRLGISTKDLQVYQYGVEQVGGSAEGAEKALTKMSREMVDAAEGKGDAAAIYRGFGISVTDAQGRIRSLTDVLPEVADHFSKIKDPALRTRVAFELFGKEGTKFAEVLKGGSAGLAQFQKEAEESGAILGGNAIDKLHAFDDGIAALSRQFEVFKADAFVELMPVLMGLLKEVSTFLIKNKADFIKWVKSFGENNLPDIITTIVGAFKALGGIVMTILGILDILNKVFGAHITTMIVLATTIFAGPILAFGQLVVSILSLTGALPIVISAVQALVTTVWGLVGSVLAALAPFALIIAAIALVGFAAYELIKHWDVVKNYFSELWDDPTKKFHEFIDLITSSWDRVKGFFGFGTPSLGGASASGGAIGAQAATQAIAGTNQPTPVTNENKFTFDFLNMPRGVQFKTEQASSDVAINRGMGMAL